METNICKVSQASSYVTLEIVAQGNDINTVTLATAIAVGNNACFISANN